MKKALITGTNGQDGSYLAELLLSGGYEVYGTIRKHTVDTLDTDKIDHIKSDLTLQYVDVTDSVEIDSFIRSVKPDEIYHLASMFQVRESFERPLFALRSITVSTLNILESLKSHVPHARLCYASSGSIYGRNGLMSQSEASPTYPVSPYAIAKLAAHHFIQQYRESFNLFTVNSISFGHESPRSSSAFVIKKIVEGAVAISKGELDKLRLGNIHSQRDWGHAKDYVRAMYLMLQYSTPQDFICATGIAHSVEDVCRYTFDLLGMDYADYIVSDPKFMRPNDSDLTRGNASKLEDLTGWAPSYTFTSMIDEMVEDALRTLGDK